MKKPKSVQTTFSQYTIGDVKGEGGSGVVYEAFDDEGNQFAIKALDPQKAFQEKLKRFKNEFSFCSKNKHPNIITVLDHGLTDDGIPFFVMPLFDYSLRKLIGNIDPEVATRLFGEILNGVEAAHKLGVVHRDIKPENILVRAEANELVLADFGIAEFEKEDLYTAVETKDGTRLANFQYAAPEQRSRGQIVDHHADIYSLGLILNELFTGEIPFGTNFRKISDVTDNYPYLDAIVEKMLEQNLQSRFDSI
ncbi:MAG: serine/threonine protein kinase [Gammaproteobacteria bacterium]|nr:serine/threonine protein kinase [Gammaproteobacteria bacterium]